ncbi:hypothetical protein D9M68_622660 [compost metagenome]
MSLCICLLLENFVMAEMGLHASFVLPLGFGQICNGILTFVYLKIELKVNYA